MIIEHFQQLFEVSHTETKKKEVAKWIPYLCKLGLSALQIIPKRVFSILHSLFSTIFY